MSRTRSLMEEEIIRVAIQCFSERGYQNTTLDDIVSQVNISRVTFYTYFKSKETLLKTIYALTQCIQTLFNSNLTDFYFLNIQLLGRENTKKYGNVPV